MNGENFTFSEGYGIIHSGNNDGEMITLPFPINVIFFIENLSVDEKRRD